ncbi:MAG: hypothetical protein EOP41_03490 [Sphingobacteriaceae bacterium]|nr:MAG: hypothetical protein EOP41_03490 [Sphingobacteriaceae bacterium]
MKCQSWGGIATLPVLTAVEVWLMEHDASPRYRCHTGHVYSERLLMEKQNEQLEESLWVSIRMLEERRNLLLTMTSPHAENLPHAVQTQHARAAELNKHIGRLKDLLITLSQEKKPKDEGYL